jgi:hypothetical protein
MEEKGKFVQLTPEALLEDAIGLINRAQDKNIYLRILGALAVFIHSGHCPQYREYFFRLGRLGEGMPIFTDLDMMGYSRQSPEVRKFLEKEAGFKPDLYINSLPWNAISRNIFHKEGAYDVDVFYDRLNFSHPVEFGRIPGKGRLELDFPTIALTDIVLEKLQIHFINKKDLVDLIILFCGHELGETDEKEKINVAYISKTLANNWGFWYDAKANLEKVQSIAGEFNRDGKIETADLDMANRKIMTLLQRLDNEPKGKAWNLRARKGTKEPWFQDVEEVDR